MENQVCLLALGGYLLLRPKPRKAADKAKPFLLSGKPTADNNEQATLKKKPTLKNAQWVEQFSLVCRNGAVVCGSTNDRRADLPSM